MLRPHALAPLVALALLAVAGVRAEDEAAARPAPEKPAQAAAAGPPTWYAQALARGAAGLNVTHFWSKGPWLRAETVVAGHKVVNIVKGPWYYAYDGLTGRGIAVRRDPKAEAKDAPDRRPFGREYEILQRQGAELIRELERKLMFFEEGWPAGGREFLQAVDAYADFHWKHMRKEENELLPLAEKHLIAEDWRAIERAFAENRDPISGIEERDFQKLFSRIANIAPAPVGLGDPWKKAPA